jgi:glycosyltransferase involved in cell wall biosynthesis
MLEAIERDPRRWPHAEAWAERMRTWAARAQTLIVPTHTNAERAEALLGVDHLTVIPNGYDSELFFPEPLAHEDTVLLYVGRFTEVKRVPLLIEAYAHARPGFNTRAPLVLVGGYPGETEGEHPRDTIARTGAQDVHLAGWHPHEDLPRLLNAADAIVLPSVREQFGQSLVEGMACGLPGIAVDAYGPADIVRHGETGWLVDPDDLQGLANALVEVVNRPSERLRRGLNAAADVRERFAWDVVAQEVANLYDATILRADAAQTV